MTYQSDDTNEDAKMSRSKKPADDGYIYHRCRKCKWIKPVWAIPRMECPTCHIKEFESFYYIGKRKYIK